MNEKDILKSSMFNAIFRGNDLITHFTRGAFVYVYKNISEEDKKLMIESESKGKYLIKNIKPKYDFIKTEYKTLSECYEKFK